MRRHSTDNNEAPRVYIEYNSYSSGGERLSDEEWSCRADERTTLDVRKLYAREPTHIFFKDSVEVEPSVLECEEVYLVVARYTTGDTFGTSYGKFHFYSVRATEEEARKDREAINAPASEGDYRPWDGYFEHLEDVEIHRMRLSR
jgi:hypothetical protein